MPVPNDVLAFAGIAVLLAMTPGPDMAMVTKSALRGGRQAAVLTTVGIACALAIHTTAASFGLAAILRSAAALFTVVKLVGAAYLIYLGAQALWSSFHSGRSDVKSELSPSSATAGTAPSSIGPPWRTPFRQGFLSALLNPKLLVFFATLLPQFIDQNKPFLPQMLILGLIFDAIGLTWLSLYGLLVTALRDFFASPKVRNSMERVTGFVLIGLGARLAIEKL